MTTHRRTWQKREGKAAALFGARRQRCSGSSGRPDCSRSDSTHPALYLETKLRQHHAAVALLDGVKGQARREGRVPVLCLATKGRRGIVLVMDAEDLSAIAAEWAKARAQAPPADVEPEDLGPPPAA
jgi:hypothetical protein